VLCDDAEYWIENQSFSEEEIAARFQHRLVFIHLFPNGNGRHARLIADIVMEYIFNKPPFIWGRADLLKSGDNRKKYIESLNAADKGEYGLLMDFIKF